MREKIKQLYIEGYNSKEIAEKTGKTQVSVQKFIQRNMKQFKKAHLEQRKIRESQIEGNKIERVKSLYLRGYNAKEIAEILCVSHQYIRVLISKNLKEFGFEHRKARALNKSIKKAIDTKNNSYMCNTAFLKQNRQSYKLNKNGNLVFDEETRGTKTEDVPKAFYKRNL